MVRMEDKTSNYKMMHPYQELKNAKSSGKAIIATARKLSRIIYIMLKSNTPFDSRKLTDSTEKPSYRMLES